MLYSFTVRWLLSMVCLRFLFDQRSLRQRYLLGHRQRRNEHHFDTGREEVYQHGRSDDRYRAQCPLRRLDGDGDVRHGPREPAERQERRGHVVGPADTGVGPAVGRRPAYPTSTRSIEQHLWTMRLNCNFSIIAIKYLGHVLIDRVDCHARSISTWGGASPEANVIHDT